jgi:malonyl-CoA/methylmalonyl-CoA synthetase
LQNCNLYALFQSCFPSNPDAIFLEHERGTLKYSELDPATGKMLNLLQQLGLKKGDRVIMQVDKSPEAVVHYLACLRAGAIFIPLNTAYTADEVAYFIEDAEPQLMVCAPASVESISRLALKFAVPHVLTLDAYGEGSLIDKLDGLSVSEDIEHCNIDDLACILYTSGTTGRAKGAMLSHGNLASNAKTLHTCWHWQEGDVLLHALPIFHVHGLFVALHCALLNASSVIFLSKFDLDTVKLKLPHATVMMGVPTFYVRLLSDPEFNRKLCENMRVFISGSAPLLTETFSFFEQRTGHRILERYGMTEALMITSNPYLEERVAGTVGFALPDIQARIGDNENNEVSRGEVGILEFTGPNVFKGYWRMPEKTAEEFTGDGYFISGDMATMDEHGRISIVGRTRDLVISGGYNVYPKEVELVIDEIEGVKESAIIGVTHPDFGEAVCAVVVKETEELTSADILAKLNNKLARFKQPKQVFFVEELPRNAMGKVQKKELRERYNDIYTG